MFNPFFRAGQFFATKLIILIKCLIDIHFSKCCSNVFYVEQHVNLAWQSCSGLENLKIA